MNPLRAKRLLPVIQGFANGKSVQRKLMGQSKWQDTDTPAWLDDADYRLKPEPCCYALMEGLGKNQGLLASKKTNTKEALERWIKEKHNEGWELITDHFEGFDCQTYGAEV